MGHKGVVPGHIQSIFDSFFPSNVVGFIVEKLASPSIIEL